MLFKLFLKFSVASSDSLQDRIQLMAPTCISEEDADFFDQFGISLVEIVKAQIEEVFNLI